MSRKPLSKKIRFEVFKRDSFTCQYCGGKAPDVILHVDHIKPVAEGGSGEIVNLVTACFDCNSGKGKRELDDKAVISKQRKQLDSLNERRIQLEMMAEWRKQVNDMRKQEVDAIAEAIPMIDGFSISENGRAKILRWLKRFPVEKIFECIDISFGQYARYDKDGQMTEDTWEKAFGMITRILEIRCKPGFTEAKAKINYIGAILYNRGVTPNKYFYAKELEKAVEYNFDMDELAEIAKMSDTRDFFEDHLNDMIEKRYTEITGRPFPQ